MRQRLASNVLNVCEREVVEGEEGTKESAESAGRCSGSGAVGVGY